MTGQLFNLSDVSGEPKKNGKHNPINSLKKEQRIRAQEAKAAKRFSKCSAVLGKIRKGQTIHLVSAADWSAHDVIRQLIETTGPVDLWFATWSISEGGLREILRLRDSGKIKSINAIIDWRVLVRNREAVQLARAQADNIATHPCHAKVYVLKNKDWAISVVGSANLTNNPRIEASVITENAEIADFHTGWMKEVIDNTDPFEENQNG